MQVPEHLQDYVILHELCHTVHHNHSVQFWALMDEVTDGKAHALRKELRKYHTN
jgi:predicted metal-dependent hydrolase